MLKEFADHDQHDTHLASVRSSEAAETPSAAPIGGQSFRETQQPPATNGEAGSPLPADPIEIGQSQSDRLTETIVVPKPRTKASPSAPIAAKPKAKLRRERAIYPPKPQARPPLFRTQRPPASARHPGAKRGQRRGP